jgi:transcriptional regulator GlxA family with amidase domain
LIQMISYTERWDGRHVSRKDENFEFLVAIKKILPDLNNKALPIMLPTTDNEQMQRIIKYLEKNIGERLTIKTVSSHFNISERTLSRLFQSTMQISFLQYLKTIRMVKAIEMILKTQRPISDIAYEVGYVTISSFSDAFQEFTHARPTDFRKH